MNESLFCGLYKAILVFLAVHDILYTITHHVERSMQHAKCMNSYCVLRATCSMLRILGIDPGTATTGWGVVEEKNGKLAAVGYGAIETSKNRLPSERLLEISEDLEKLFKKYQPDAVAVEKLFFFKNQKTIIEVAQARGAILLTLERMGVTIAEYTPLQVKQALTGYGRADKNQMQEMTKAVLGLASVPKPDDAADALAIAVCHAHSQRAHAILSKK